MSTRRNIIWRPDLQAKDGKRYANIHVLVGYNQGSITDFKDMLEIIREVAPGASEDDVHGSKVIKSGCVEGFTILAHDTYLESGEYEGWNQSNKDTPPREQDEEKGEWEKRVEGQYRRSVHDYYWE